MWTRGWQLGRTASQFTDVEVREREEPGDLEAFDLGTCRHGFALC